MPFPTATLTCPHCTGRDGRPKRLYRSRAEAEDTADHRHAVSGVHLRAYPCPGGGGWHLTKQPERCR